LVVKKTIRGNSKKKKEIPNKKKPTAEKKPAKNNNDEADETTEGGPKIWEGPDGKKYCNISYLAKSTDLSIRELRHLQQQGIIEPAIKNKGKESAYDFAKCYSAMFAYYKKIASSRRSGDSKEMEEEKLRQLAAKRELEEMKVLRARGELHHADDIKRIFGGIFSRVHTGFESFPLGLAPKLAGKTNIMEIAGEIKTQLDKILYEITEYDIEALKMNVGYDYLAGLEADEENNEQNDRV